MSKPEEPNLDPKNFKPAIVYTIYIAASPEKVWEALTTAEFSRQYFSGFAIEADLKIGGAFIARARFYHQPGVGLALCRGLRHQRQCLGCGGVE